MYIIVIALNGILFISIIVSLLFATNEVQFTDNAIDNFLTFVDHMSCSADTYVSLGGSNGCAVQLTNWDGTQKVGLGAVNLNFIISPFGLIFIPQA